MLQVLLRFFVHSRIKILIEEGVDHRGVLSVPEEESGQAYISISKDGSNEIHTYFGANLKITEDHIMDKERLDLIRQVKVCVIMDPPLKTAKKLVELCKENGVKVIWDPGVYANDGIEALLPVMQNVDYFILNHIEFENLLGTSDPKMVAEALAKFIKNINVIIKYGSKGCIMCEGNTNTLIQMEAVPLKELGLEVVNTVGCGDAFIGGFASGLIQEKSHEEALRQACAVGSYKATKVETRGGPSKEQLERLMDAWKRL